MRELTYVEALKEAHVEEMRRDERVLVIGEDVSLGYVFGVTRGLVGEFGAARVIDTPLMESAIIGSSLGMALGGLRPIPEIMFIDFITLGWDHLFNHAAKLRWQTGGQVKVPLTVRCAYGAFGHLRAGPCHSQSITAWFMHTPGLKVAIPSTPADAKGLLKTAIRDDNPVVFLEHKALYPRKGPVPDGEYTIPFGEADVKREGKDVTIIAIGNMVHRALRAAEVLDAEGVSCAVVDPRTLAPLDTRTLVEAVRQTERAVVVEEDTRTCGVGAEIVAMLVEEAFDSLNAPVLRVGSKDLVIGAGPTLEEYVIPSVQDIVDAVKRVLYRA